jgi:hypothetical protein
MAPTTICLDLKGSATKKRLFGPTNWSILHDFKLTAPQRFPSPFWPETQINHHRPIPPPISFPFSLFLFPFLLFATFLMLMDISPSLRSSRNGVRHGTVAEAFPSSSVCSGLLFYHPFATATARVCDGTLGREWSDDFGRTTVSVPTGPFPALGLRFRGHDWRLPGIDTHRP